MPTHESSYGYARFVVGVLNFFGTIAGIIGIVGLALDVFSMANSINSGSSGMWLALLLVLAPFAGLLIAGIVIVAFSELVRSQLDTADDTRQLLHSMTRAIPRESREF